MDIKKAPLKQGAFKMLDCFRLPEYPIKHKCQNSNKYAEVNRTFWRQTVLPLVGRTANALSTWLNPAFGGEVRLWFDADQVDALSTEREALWNRVQAADFLTQDEKRQAVGYGSAADR